MKKVLFIFLEITVLILLGFITVIFIKQGGYDKALAQAFSTKFDYPNDNIKPDAAAVPHDHVTNDRGIIRQKTIFSDAWVKSSYGFY